MSKQPKLGLCCISEILKDKTATGNRFRTITAKSARGKTESQRKKILKEIILHNAYVQHSIIKHCVSMGIPHYRLSSALFPLIGERTVGFGLDFLEAYDDLLECFEETGKTIRNSGITISSHPDQYVVLASERHNVVRNSLFEIEKNAWLHNKLGLPRDYSNPINIHPGISKPPSEEIRKRFLDAFGMMAESARNRLVLENEDKGRWNCKELFEYFSDHFPLTFDNLHHYCNPPDSGDEEFWAKEFATTWEQRGFTPVFHWSEGWGKTGREQKKHADYFTHIPESVKNNPDCIWECEVKMKDKAIENARNRLKWKTTN